jgi:hypothetical protein
MTVDTTRPGVVHKVGDDAVRAPALGTGRVQPMRRWALLKEFAGLAFQDVTVRRLSLILLVSRFRLARPQRAPS